MKRTAEDRLIHLECTILFFGYAALVVNWIRVVLEFASFSPLF
jgi:hypothetical protein